MFKDTKRLIRSRTSKKDIHYNGQKTKRQKDQKKTTTKNTIPKTNARATGTPLDT